MCSWPAVASFVPSGHKRIVKRPEEIRERHEAVQVVSIRIRGVVSGRRQVDGGLQSQRPVALESICPKFKLESVVGLPLPSTSAHLSATKTSQ